MSAFQTASPSAVDAEAFRRAMAKLPTSVAIAATTVDGEPVGMIVGTFTSISLDPPLVGFFGDHRSQTVSELLRGDGIAFSVLEQSAQAVAQQFRRPLDERFGGVEWGLSPAGNPVLALSVLVVEGVVDSVVTIGDHDLVVVAVTAVRIDHDRPRPLIFHDRRLGRLDPTVTGALALNHLEWTF